MTEPSRAVFVSYASQDQPAAQRICDALRTAGIEVWFDQSALRGGDVWDQTIRKQIKTCVLFIPVVSRNTHDREEGYFRLEWKLAVDRSHLMTSNKAFLMPVVIDDTREDDENVPDRFKDIHWTRLPGGETPSDFVERVRRLVSPQPSREPAAAQVLATSPLSRSAAPMKERVPAFFRSKWALLAIVAVVGSAAVGYFAIDRFTTSKHPLLPSVPPSVPAAAAPAAFSPPPHSIAVLPFVDMSEHHDQEYFTDGMTEELISRLAQAADLKVVARTSSFQFKGKSGDVRIIAGKLGVANLMEGSIRKSGTRLRVTVQLVRAADGVHIWSQSYDRNERDILKVQDEIADSVAKSLSVSLKLDSDSTPSMSEAYALFLHAREIGEHGSAKESNYRTAIALLEEVVRKDPRLGNAWADLSRMRVTLYLDHPEIGTRDATRTQALEEAERALQLSPQLAESHLALARILMFIDWEWKRAETEMRRALELGPNSASVQRNAYYLATFLGRWDGALQRAKKAAELDPLGANNFQRLAEAQANAGAFADAEKSYRVALSLDPQSEGLHSGLAGVLWNQGKSREAVAENSREPDEESKLPWQAYFEQKLGHPRESTMARDEFVAKYGRWHPFDVGFLFAYLGQPDDAFQWWNRAIAERHTEAAYLLTATRDPIIPNIGSDPRFKALVRRMKLPE